MSKLATIAVALALLVASSAMANGFIEPYRSLCMLSTAAGQGSGTLIAKGADGKGLILTCRHVAKAEGEQVLVRFIWADGGEVTKGTVARVIKGQDFDTDLALVVIDRVPDGITVRPVVRFTTTKAPWIGAGFRSGVMRITHPINLAIERPDGLIIFPTPLVGGMSGGPLFDRHGNVVAVLVASDFSTTGIAADGVLLRRMISEFLAQ